MVMHCDMIFLRVAHNEHSDLFATLNLLYLSTTRIYDRQRRKEIMKQIEYPFLSSRDPNKGQEKVIRQVGR